MPFRVVKNSEDFPRHHHVRPPQKGANSKGKDRLEDHQFLVGDCIPPNWTIWLIKIGSFPKIGVKKWKILETMRHLDFLSEYVVHFKQQIWNKTRFLSKDWNNIPFQNIPFPLHPWRLTAGTCPHGCLVQINFRPFFSWVICRFDDHIPGC